MNRTPFVALVLAAGFGTRLAPLTHEIPKPLVPIGNRPLLLQILENLHEEGASRLAVNVHYKSNEIIKSIQQLQFNVYVSHEEVILGTAGGAARAMTVLNEASLVLINGDIYGQLPLPQLLAAADLGLTMAVTRCAPGTGTVGIGADGRVVRLRGQVFGAEVAGGNYMGLAHLGADCLAALPERGCLVGDYALPHLHAGGRVGTVVVEADFIDVGSMREYWRANMRSLTPLGSAPSDDSLVDHGVTIEPSVVLRRCVIGEGARVSGVGLVEECVVLPGAHLQAPARRLVVTASGQSRAVAEHGALGA